MDYALSQRETRVGYYERGDLQISNALAENAIVSANSGRRRPTCTDNRNQCSAYYMLRLTLSQRHLQRIKYQFGFHLRGHGLANDSAAENIQNDGKV